MTTSCGSLQREREKENQYDKHAVAMIYDSFNLNRAVGHVSLYWSELVDNFLKFSIHYICVVVTGIIVS